MAKKKKRTTPAPPASGQSGRAWSGPATILAKLEQYSIAALFIYLLSSTWMRWSDPLVDFPRDLYTAWRLSEGDLLYTDVMSWYGPLSHLVQGAAFHVFGTGLDTMVWLNVVVTICILLLLRAILGILGNRLVVWLGSVVFLVGFAFAQLVTVSNYNFITPYAGQATYGLLGCLITVWACLRHIRKGHARWLWLAGAGVAIAYLNKPEPLLAAAVVAMVYLLVSALWRARAAPPRGGPALTARWCGQAIGWLTAGFLSVWLAVFLILARMGGWAYAAGATNRVAQTLAGGAFREVGLSSKFNAALLGFDAPGQNFLRQLVAGGLFVLVVGVVLLAGRMWARAPGGSLQRGVAALLAGGVALIAGLAVNWQEFGWAVVFPAVLAAVLAFSLAVRAAWQSREDFSRFLGLAVFGAAAVSMLARMPLHGNISHYGFFMQPLAVLFLLVVLICEGPRATAGSLPPGWLAPAAFTLITLGGVCALERVSSKFYAQKTYAVGEGRDRFFAFSMEVNANGFLLKSVIDGVKAHAPGAATLVAFPESAAFNYHLRTRNPIPEMEFQPTTLDFMGRERVLGDLAKHPPEVIVLYTRNLDEYGVLYFGANEYAGADIAQWILQHYYDKFALMLKHGTSPYNLTGNLFDIYEYGTPPPQ